MKHENVEIYDRITGHTITLDEVSKTSGILGQWIVIPSVAVTLNNVKKLTHSEYIVPGSKGSWTLDQINGHINVQKPLPSSIKSLEEIALEIAQQTQDESWEIMECISPLARNLEKFIKLN